MNDYQKLYNASSSSPIDSYDSREDARAKFGYAVPNDEAIQALAALGPIIEIGAGLGYWAKLITEAGGNVEAFDKYPGEKTTYPTLKGAEAWYSIAEGDHEVVKDSDRDVLLMIWPCYEKAWSGEALGLFAGSTIAYVGEGPHGCTGSDEFHEILAAKWDAVHTVHHPSWAGLHDYLTIYNRI